MTTTESCDGSVQSDDEGCDTKVPHSGERITTEATTTLNQQWLYFVWDTCWDGCWDRDTDGSWRHITMLSPEVRRNHNCREIRTYPITKVTAKRIYFRDNTVRQREHFIGRATFHADDRGDTVAYHQRLRELLYLNEPTWHLKPKPKSIADLRREMADAHPDRGGDRHSFTEARRRYLQARSSAPSF